MIPELRRQFNGRYTPERYQRFLQMLDAGCGTHVKFRNCETPCFFPRPLIERVENYGRELIMQLMSPEYLKRSDETIPARISGSQRRCAAAVYPGRFRTDGGAGAETRRDPGVSFALCVSAVSTADVQTSL